MKQLLQNLKTGRLTIEEVPQPVLRDEGILVRSRVSLISAGTERMVMKLAKKGLLGKARARPDLVRKVLAKLRREGLGATLRAVRDRMNRDMPLGYSLAGAVIAVGSRAERFRTGQLVACAGAGYANHAEINYVPRLLAAPVPEGVSSEAAAYTTVGAIALQGVRNADLRTGETAVVLGLGLIGQLTVQILAASGCRVVGLDPSDHRVRLAAEHGAGLALPNSAERLQERVLDFTRGRGADAVLIAAATSSHQPVELAAQLARDRARIVMVGVTGMEIPRNPYFEKELTFVVSRSYGPGRYDADYEEHGRDYPVGYVRWTENRNLEAVLDLVASGRIHPGVCTTHRFPIADAPAAMELVLTGREPHLGVLLTYPEAPQADVPAASRIVLGGGQPPKPVDTVGVSFIGAGNFARSVLIPHLARMEHVRLRGIVTASGLTARSTCTKHGFAFCASNEVEVLDDAETDAVFVATPHSQHADAVCRALAAGKAAFVEKPLAISLEQVRQILEMLGSHPGRLMVGFNRRFAPLALELKEFFAGCGPRIVHYRCNAGPLPSEHWIADPAEGGRILGEACHFLDFFAFLTDSQPETVYAAGPTGGRDDAAVTVSYADGSVCQLIYTSSGSERMGKERVEVFAGGRSAELDDFSRLVLHSPSGRRNRVKRFGSDKGHAAELAAFVEALRNGNPMPIPADSLIATTLVALAAVQSIGSGRPVQFPELMAQVHTLASQPQVDELPARSNDSPT